MTQKERRLFLIRSLLEEQPQYQKMEIPGDEEEQKRLLRSLMNLRHPSPVQPEFLDVQDAYLKEETLRRGIVDCWELAAAGAEGVKRRLFLWQGDITRLKADAIVNAANEALLGCFYSLPLLHRQHHPHLRRSPAAAGLPPPDAGAGAPRAHGPGEDHARLQSAQPLCAAHRGACDFGAVAGAGLPPAGGLLFVLPGAGREKRPEIRRVLLYLHRRVPLSAGEGRRNRSGDGETVSGTGRYGRAGDF